MSLVAMVIVYGNVAMIFNPQKLLPFLPNPWPTPFAIQDAFLLTGMFTSFATENIDFMIGGRTVPRHSVDTPNEKPTWIVLDLDEMFTGRMGIKFTQVLAARHWDMLGKQAQQDAWHLAAKKIRARHNRLHPDQPVDAVRIGVQLWPLSPDGYRAAKRRSKNRYVDWYNDETYKP
jgi:hypothetical protein